MENNSTDHHHHGLLLVIPGDVFIQILVWLPIITLLRFKSVCKSWRALIESSFFIHLHAAVTTTTSCSSSNKFGTLIFQTSPLFYTDESRIFMLTPSPSRRRSGGGGGGGDEVFEVKDLGLPPLCKTDLARWKMVGSCNGLICSKLKRVVSLWNPATRQFRLLPKSSFLTTTTTTTFKEEEKIRINDVFGFGFDVKTKDYKVVQITSFSLQRNMEFRVQVYSLSRNSWRVLEEDIMISLFPKQQPFEELNMSIHDGLYLQNGSFFFKGTYEGIEDRGKPRHWILSFDFTKEIFTPINLFPDAEQLQLLDSNSTLILTYFGAHKIAFLVQSYYSSSREEGRTDFVYDIWVLNNNNEEHDQDKQEDKESYYYWTKLQHSIRISPSYNGWVFPKVISDDGEFALIETRGASSTDRKLQLFNLVTKEEKTVFVYPTGMGLLRAGVYKPSLVSIIGGGNGNGHSCSSR